MSSSKRFGASQQLKTPLKEIKMNAEERGAFADTADTEARHFREPASPEGFSRSEQNCASTSSGYQSPPPNNRKRYSADRSPPTEFNKKTSYLLRNGIVQNQVQMFELDND